MSSKLELQGIWFKNFMSFGDKLEYIPLDTNNLTVIKGENYDVGMKGTSRSNGSAKSVILDAISYALRGKSLRGITNPSLVNKTMKKNMFVAIEYKRNGYHFRIERGLLPDRFAYYKKPEGCLDPWDHKHKNPTTGELEFAYNRTEKRKEDTNRTILIEAGIKDCLFDLVIGMSSVNRHFFEMRAEEKREVMENLIGMSLLAEVSETLKEDRKAYKIRLAEVDSAISTTIKANERLQAQITDLEATSKAWETSHAQNLSNVLAALKTIPTDLEDRIEILKKCEELSNKQNVNNQIKIARQNEYNEALKQYNLQASRITTLEKTFSDWERTNKERIKTLEDSIESLKEIDVENEITILEAISSYQEEYKDLLSKQMMADQFLASSKKEKSNYEKTDARLREDIKKKEAEIKSVKEAVCPTCNQHWEADSTVGETLNAEWLKLLKEFDINFKANLDAEELDKEQTSISTECKAKAKEISEGIAELKSVLTLKSIDEANKLNLQIAEKEAALANLLAETNPHTSTLNDAKQQFAVMVKPSLDISDIEDLTGEITSLQEEASKGLNKPLTMKDAQAGLTYRDTKKVEKLRLEQEVNPHIDTIQNLKTALEAIDYTEQTHLNDLVSHVDLLINLMTKPDSFIRKELVNRYLPPLNNQIVKYFKENESEYKLRFNPDLTYDIVLDHDEFEFDALSKGEQFRLKMALSFAFQDLYEMTFNGFNFLFVDELLDNGTDAPGAETAVNILRDMIDKKKKSVFLITHREDIANRADNIITVRKEKKISSIVRDDDE